LIPSLLLAQGNPETEPGPYARIAFLRPHDGDTVDFEAGYIRHLEFHRQARDGWAWDGWAILAGAGQRWGVCAPIARTPARSAPTAAALDPRGAAADDERHSVSNVTPQVPCAGSALYESLPGLSRGPGVPTATARLELTTVDLNAGAASAFEAALSAEHSTLR